MSGDDETAAMDIGATLGGASIALFAGAGSWLAIQAYREGQFSRGLRWMRIWVLGGVTTLDQALDYDCAMCGHSLDQREQVRTLSCGHVFHLRKGAKCAANTIDDWLRENPMRCPACCKVVSAVLPCKAPPTSAPPPAPTPAQTSGSSTDLEAQQPRLPALQQQPPHQQPTQWFQDALRFGSPHRSGDSDA